MNAEAIASSLVNDATERVILMLSVPSRWPNGGDTFGLQAGPDGVFHVAWINSVNDVMQHVFQSALPFGGCGNSGFGRYHGDEGFKAFSVARGVYVAPRLDVLRVLRPPYAAAFRRVLGALLRR